MRTLGGFLLSWKWKLSLPAFFVMLHLLAFRHSGLGGTPFTLAGFAFELPGMLSLSAISKLNESLDEAVECSWNRSLNGRCIGVQGPVPLALTALKVFWGGVGFFFGVFLDWRRKKAAQPNSAILPTAAFKELP